MEHSIDIPDGYQLHNNIDDYNEENLRQCRHLLGVRLLIILSNIGLISLSIYALSVEPFVDDVTSVVSAQSFIMMSRIILTSYSLKNYISGITQANYPVYSKLRSGLDLMNLAYFIVTQISYFEYNDKRSYLGYALLGSMIYYYILYFFKITVLLALLAIFKLCSPCRPQIYSLIIYLFNFAPEVQNGLPEADLEKIKCIRYTEELGLNDNCCAICLDDYEEGNIISELPCKHYFHKDCSDKWLVINKSCSVCRRDVIS